MNIWHDYDSNKIKKDSFTACIEISAGSKNKYELDKDTGMLRLDRVLYTSTHYPENYGFIPKTYAEDNDPLDVLVLCSQPILPMTLVDCKPIGVLKMVDNGLNDEKILAVCPFDPTYNSYQSIEELPIHIFEEVKHFFEVYKFLEHKETTVTEICSVDEAQKIIEEAINRYKEKFPGK